MKAVCVGLAINKGCSVVEVEMEGEVGHRGSRFTVCSHKAAAEQEKQQEGVEKEKR